MENFKKFIIDVEQVSGHIRYLTYCHCRTNQTTKEGLWCGEGDFTIYEG